METTQLTTHSDCASRFGSNDRVVYLTVALRRELELLETIDALQAEIKNLRTALEEVADLAGWHTDDAADPEDQSPEDAVSHVNGLIRQTCWSALGVKTKSSVDL